MYCVCIVNRHIRLLNPLLSCPKTSVYLDENRLGVEGNSLQPVSCEDTSPSTDWGQRMPKKILAADQEQTPKADILGKAWYGEFQLLCTTYASDEVVMQVRVPGGTWNNAKFNGRDIKLTAAGEVLDVKLVKDYEYQLMTANDGAEVFIAKHDPHG